MPKTKVFAARNLEDGLPNLPLKTGEAKKKIKVFLSRQFCASLTNTLPIVTPTLYQSFLEGKNALGKLKAEAKSQGFFPL
jgi:hypothetical protein